MKKLIYIFLVALLMNSCDKFLDVQPKGSIIPNSVEHYDKMLNAEIDFLSNPIYMGPECYIPESIISNIQKSQLRGYTWSDYQFLREERDGNWSSFYKKIFVCNEIINNVDSKTTDNNTLKQSVKGWAYAERAKCYFALVNMYAKHYSANTLKDLGVPILTKNDIVQKQPRATIGEVYDLIHKDLKIAIENCPDRVIKAEKMKPTKQAVYSFRAKVYLYQKEFAKALSDINKAFELGEPKLNRFSDFQKINDNDNMPEYAKDNDEIIWQCLVSSNFWGSYVYYSKYILDKIDTENDLRYLFKMNVVGGAEVVRYKNIQERSYGCTAPEMYLLRAELNARIGDKAIALSDLNKLRENRYKADSNYKLTDKDGDILSLVKDEWLREFAFTGQSWFDLKRYATYGETIDSFTRTILGETYTLKPGSNRYVLSIPRGIIDKNDLLIQNPR